MHKTGSGRGLPGVYFYYEVSPVQAVVTERRGHGGFWRFICSIAAVLGGCYSVFRLIDANLSAFLELYRKGLLR